MRFRVIRYKFDEFSDHDFRYLQLCGWLHGVIFVKRRNHFDGGVLGSFSIDSVGFWTIEFFYPQLWGWLQGVVFGKIGTENHCGRCTRTPICLVQIWVLHLGGFPVSCLQISLQLAKITHLAWFNANYGLNLAKPQRGRNHAYWALIQWPFGTFSDLDRENRRYSLQVMSNLSFLDVFRRKIVETQDIWLFLKKGIVRWNVLNIM